MCLSHIYNSNSMRCACDVGTLKYVDQKRSNQFIRFSYSAAYTNAIMRHILNSDLTKRICTRTKCDSPQTKTACFFPSYVSVRAGQAIRHANIQNIPSVLIRDLPVHEVRKELRNHRL